MAKRLPPGSPALLRRLNAATVLQTIRAEGPVSRAELSRTTGLSKPTVNGAVELLLEQGYLTESDGDGSHPRRPGRRPRLLRFAGSRGHVLGVDIGANKVLAVAADLAGEVVAVERRRTTARARRDPSVLLELVRDVARRALDTAGVQLDTLEAVGVGTPGVVDPVSGRVSLAPQLSGFEGIELGRMLEQAFPCPVLVDNEVRLALLAEQWRGAARGVDHALFVQIGVGIGGGILFGGEVYRGAAGAAGEIGSLPLFDGDVPEGGLGPFEDAAGGTAFARLGREAAEASRSTALVELAGGDPAAIDAETVFAAARSGDEVAQEVLASLLDRLARGIAAAIVVLDPARVIVGGGVSRAGRSLLDPLESRIRPLVPVPPQIALSELGDEAVALGGVRLALQEVEERLFAFAGLLGGVAAG